MERCVDIQFKTFSIIENYMGSQIAQEGGLPSTNNTVADVRQAKDGEKF